VRPRPTLIIPTHTRYAIVLLRLELFDVLTFKRLDKRLFRLRFLLSRPTYDAQHVTLLPKRFYKPPALQQTSILLECAVLQPVCIVLTRMLFYAAPLRCAVAFLVALVSSFLTFRASWLPF
jgi:hypothetical protein